MAEYLITHTYDRDYVNIYSEILGTQHQLVATIHIDFLDDMIPGIADRLDDDGELMIELYGVAPFVDDDPVPDYDPRTEALKIGERNPGLAGGPR